MKLAVLTEDGKWLKELKTSFKGDELQHISYRDELLKVAPHVNHIILDMDQAGHYGTDLVSDILKANPRAGVVVVTPLSSLDAGVEAMHHGAAFYLTKPVDTAALKDLMAKLGTDVGKKKSAEPSIAEITRQMFMGSSPQMERVIRLVNKVSHTESTILITGESGTGKELVSRLIHQQSRRNAGPFVAVNCGAIHENLIESELFGHVKGSFTGAISDKEGLFEVADGGTLFLDEVGDLPLSAQVKVLRFLQDKHIRRVGDTVDHKVDARILAATNRDLSKAIAEGQFREDLFFRLNVFKIHLPPLRERRDSIPHLIRYFMKVANYSIGRSITKVSREAQVVLMRYDYQGNIRELESIITHAVTIADGDTIDARDLPDHVLTSGKKLPPAREESDVLTLKEVERRHIQRVLTSLQGNKGKAARVLGVSRSTLWRKLKELGINN